MLPMWVGADSVQWNRLSFCQEFGTGTVGRSLVPTGYTRVRFSFDPENNHKNYRYDIRNGPSNNLPLATLCKDPTTTLLVIGGEQVWLASVCLTKGYRRGFDSRLDLARFS